MFPRGDWRMRPGPPRPALRFCLSRSPEASPLSTPEPEVTAAARGSGVPRPRARARGRYRQSPVGGWGGLSGYRDGSFRQRARRSPAEEAREAGGSRPGRVRPLRVRVPARAQGTAEETWRPPKSRRPAGASAGTGRRFRREGISGGGAVSGACSAEPRRGRCGARVRGWGRARGPVSCGPDRARTLSGRRGIARSQRGAVTPAWRLAVRPGA